MLQWVLIFVFLVLEMVLCLAIILFPFSIRKKVLSSFARTWKNHARVRIVIKTLLAMVFGFFADSVRSIYLVEHMMSEQPEIETKAILGSSSQVNIRLFSSERNVFLTGFTLFLSIILYGFMSTAITIMELEYALDTETEKALYEKKRFNQINYELKKLQEVIEERERNEVVAVVGDSRE